MKRTALLLCTSLLTLCLLSGCGQQKEDQTAKNSQTTQASNSVDKNSEVNSQPEVSTESNGEYVKPENSSIYNISINPEVEFIVDENGMVTDVNYINEDAKTYYSSLSLKGMKVEEASKKIVNIAISKGLLKTDKGVTVKLTDPSKLSMEMYNQLIGIKDNVIEELAEQERSDAYIEFDLEGNNPEEENCSLCHGALVVACDACGGKLYGDGKLHCESCGATGKITCDLCNGSGLEQSNPCPRCDGNGKMNCNTCDGSGIMDCYRCKGTIIKVCNRCNGTNVDQYLNEPPK